MAAAARLAELGDEYQLEYVEKALDFKEKLARSLFKACEIGMEIPLALYKAVAEILAYVYSLKDKNRR